MKEKKYDFSGWATKYGLLCGDGKTIMPNAFGGLDHEQVPLVWMHQHDDVTNVLGHAYLTSKPEGVWADCKLNNTPQGQHAAELIRSKDVNSLSIWANKLQQSGGRVSHGIIREVSLVLAGANPGAMIDFGEMAHSDLEDYPDAYQDATIWCGEEFVAHTESKDDADDDEEDDDSENGETVADVYNAMTDKQKKVVQFLIAAAVNDAKGGSDDSDESDDSKKVVKHAESEEGEEMATSDKTVADVYNAMSEEQKAVVQFLVGAALKDAGVNDEDDEDEDDEDVEHGYDDGDGYMWNAFDQDGDSMNDSLSHDALAEIYDPRTIKRDHGGSLKESFLAHGIVGIDMLFPDDQQVGDKPFYWIDNDQTWVNHVMSQVHHNPTARIKTIYADITADDARAKGYVKGTLKKEQVFNLFKRTVSPTTIYKKQSFDNDDLIDIDIEMTSNIKMEMRGKLNEEIARSILISDGRSAADPDKIREDCIRPIANDADVFTIKVGVVPQAGENKYKVFINEAIRARKNYKGSGNPYLYTTEATLTECLLLEDNIGHKLYKTEAELATAMRVKGIITIQQMENTSISNVPLMGIIVNLNDYHVGTDRGGAVKLFDDFDIDYNKQKYLIETRLSGMLVKPKSAIVLFDGQAPVAGDGGVVYPTVVVTEPEDGDDDTGNDDTGTGN